MQGKPVDAAKLVDATRLITAYFTGVPDTAVPAQRVAFGTSAHRGSAFDLAESFHGKGHLQQIPQQAQAAINRIVRQ
ncbi:MAG TPA: hypothetical protein VFG62_22215 [Rhodopila sp.]|nr:hypothetical protein [Rhodopila sp.]